MAPPLRGGPRPLVDRRRLCDVARVSWLGDPASHGTPLDAVFALRPNLYARVRALAGVLWEDRLVDPVLLELCRLRVAQLLGCTAELAIRYAPARAAGLADAKVEALPRWPSDARFTAAERACLTVAERFVLDPHGLTDPEAAAARAHLGDAGLVALLEALALFDGFARFRVMLDVAPPASDPTVVPAPTRASRSMY